jgi:D-3-phosphoglycerate dehydrogenase
MLSQVNAVFSDRGINIDGQFMRTDPQVGFVVIDVSGAGDEQARELRDALDSIEGTLRTRVLY